MHKYLNIFYFCGVIGIFVKCVGSTHHLTSQILSNDLEDDEDGWLDWETINVELNPFVSTTSNSTELKSHLSFKTTENVWSKGHLDLYHGPGAMGSPYSIANPTPNQKILMEQGYMRHAFNEYISDQISVHRSLPDYRNHWCKRPGLYDEKKLLPASVVMCFHNEAYSVLLRSIHSILDRTPHHLLTEIVLVDDNSSFENLKAPLDSYLKGFPKVTLIRSNHRLGLIRARMLGAQHARGPILVFLDSHVEITEGWFEPMSDRIAKSSKNVVCPIIDIINDETLEYQVSERSVTAVGGFTWDLIFTWKTATDDVLSSLKTPADPVPSPTMAGGLFAIHKDFFNHLGQYDEEYEIWGAENLEISFKTWMCGGRLEILPCSHIGHIYRKRAPYTREGTESRPHRNYIRLAAVWLDEYAHFYYNKIGYDLGDYGDISTRLNLKQRLQCHSFEWYIQNIYPDIFNPKKATAEGEVRSEAFGGNLCLDAFSDVQMDETFKVSLSKPTIWSCHNQGGNQHWYLTQIGELRRDQACLDYAGEVNGSLKMHPCHGHHGNQFWTYNLEHGFIVHVLSRLCLTLESRDAVLVRPCQDKITQRWRIQRVNVKRLQKLDGMAKELKNTIHVQSAYANLL